MFILSGYLLFFPEKDQAFGALTLICIVADLVRVSLLRVTALFSWQRTKKNPQRLFEKYDDII